MASTTSAIILRLQDKATVKARYLTGEVRILRRLHDGQGLGHPKRNYAFAPEGEC